MPIAGRPPHGDLAQVVPQFRTLAEEAGRDPARLPVTAYASGENFWTSSSGTGMSAFRG